MPSSRLLRTRQVLQTVSIVQSFVVQHTDSSKDVQAQILNLYVELWKQIFPASHAEALATPRDALQSARGLSNGRHHILVTGSLHHVAEAFRELGLSTDLRDDS